MHLQKGDRVELRLGSDEYVDGEVVEVQTPGIFSDSWAVFASISEGGHPHFGQIGVFAAEDVSYMEEVTA